MFILGKILAALTLPPGIFIMLAAVSALLALRGKKKAAAIVCIANALAVYALSTVFVSSILVSPLENKFPPVAARADAKAIVVLGGGYLDLSPERGGEGSLTSTSEMRAVYGLELEREYGLPLVFTGGKGLDSSLTGSEAEAAAGLWRRLGVDAAKITIETESVDTRGNAERVYALGGPGPFLLVTSAFHMPRAVLAFEKAGARVIAAPTDYRAKRGRASWVDFLPGAGSLELSWMALHEYIGLLYYRLT
jgi:uncharacterized SAM-binding protein YcdF (DUF218 family)